MTTTTTQEPKPYLAYIHGGAFIVGHHHVPPKWILSAFSKDYHIVSLSYRKCPEVSIPESINDLVDSIEWIRENLSSIVKKEVDLDNYGIIGDSAGVVVDIYGPVDMFDPSFNSIPPTDINESESFLGYSIKEILEQGISYDNSKAITSSPYQSDYSTPNEILRQEWEDDNYELDERSGIRNALKSYCGKYNLYTWLCFRRQSFTQDSKGDKEFEEYIKKWNGIDLIRDSITYPPTFILHGIEDTRVPVSVSQRLINLMKEKGLEVDWKFEEGQDHGYDYKYEGPETDGWDEYIQPAVDFVNRQCGVL